MSNFTHVGGAFSTAPSVYSLPSSAASSYQGSHLGNVGLYLALRHITQQCATKVQRLFKTKPSEEAVAFRRDGYIFRDGFVATISRLEIEIGNLRKNPKEAMAKIEVLVAANQKYLIFQREKIFSVIKMSS